MVSSSWTGNGLPLEWLPFAIGIYGEVVLRSLDFCLPWLEACCQDQPSMQVLSKNWPLHPHLFYFFIWQVWGTPPQTLNLRSVAPMGPHQAELPWKHLHQSAAARLPIHRAPRLSSSNATSKSVTGLFQKQETGSRSVFVQGCNIVLVWIYFRLVAKRVWDQSMNMQHTHASNHAPITDFPSDSLNIALAKDHQGSCTIIILDVQDPLPIHAHVLLRVAHHGGPALLAWTTWRPSTLVVK